MSHRRRSFLALLAVAPVAITGVASATAPSGVTSTPPVRGTAGPLHAEHNLVELETHRHEAADVAVSTLTFAPGGSSGWHHHPGVLLVVVKSGAITFYDQHCRTQVHKAGEAFVESSDQPGLAKNDGTVNAVVHATYIVPSSNSTTSATPLRVDDPQPRGCGVS